MVLVIVRIVGIVGRVGIAALVKPVRCNAKKKTEEEFRGGDRGVRRVMRLSVGLEQTQRVLRERDREREID